MGELTRIVDWIRGLTTTGAIFLALAVLVGCWLFVGWPVAAAIGRSRRRETLRKLLGSAYRQSHAYQSSTMGIAVDEEGKRFATSEEGGIILPSSCILDVSVTEKEAGKDTLGSTTLRLETLDPRVPLIETTTSSQQESLRKIAVRLRAIQSAATKQQGEPIPAAEKVDAPNEARLEPGAASRDLVKAVCELTDAVNKLTAAMRETRQNDNK
jgi:hypothetical protein